MKILNEAENAQERIYMAVTALAYALVGQIKHQRPIKPLVEALDYVSYYSSIASVRVAGERLGTEEGYYVLVIELCWQNAKLEEMCIAAADRRYSFRTPTTRKRLSPLVKPTPEQMLDFD